MGVTPVASSSSSRSTSSSNFAASINEDQRDSCYYPGCRKDANCNCEICLASINATLDLMPFSIQKSSLTKLSASRPITHTPVSFDPSILSTPVSNTNNPWKIKSPRSTEKVIRKPKEGNARKKSCFIGKCLGWIIVLLGLIFAAESGIYCQVSEAFRPVMSVELVEEVASKSAVHSILNAKLRLLQRELQVLVVGKVSNCSDVASLWKLNQDGHLSSSSCSLYKSSMEEIRLWGWPLQTSGLLTSGLSSRSFTVLSGRVTLWLEGAIDYKVHTENSSWLQKKWSSSVIQLDPKTVVLEYRRSFMVDNTNPELFLEMLKHKLPEIVRGISHKFWCFTALGKKKRSTSVPT